MSEFSGRRVGLILMAVVILGALAVPAASAGTLTAPGERGSEAWLSANRAGACAGCCATGRYHLVRRGDNLTRIAYRYGTTVNALMGCNNIWNPNVIYVGQRLCICYPYYCPPPRPPKPPPPPPPPPSGGSWWGTYYNSRDLSGPPVLTRQDPVLMFNWGYGSPAAQVYPDSFSAQWTRSFNMQGGTWRVTVTSDDGVRVFADGVPVIDEWKVQATTTFIRDIVLPAGSHTFTVQYFEAEGVAQVGITIIKL
jgi:PA14 domain/LysM domain